MPSLAYTDIDLTKHRISSMFAFVCIVWTLLQVFTCTQSGWLISDDKIIGNENGIPLGFGSFRPWVVSVMSRFGLGSFRPCHFGLGRFGLILGWVVRPILVGRFGPIYPPPPPPPPPICYLYKLVLFYDILY